MFCIVLVAGGGGRHPDQVHPGRLMHVVLSHHHQHVHDVVRVEHEVQLAREPFLRYADGSDVDADDGDEILQDDVCGGVRGSSSVRTEPQTEAQHADDERGGEGKAATPHCGDGHGLVQTEEADPEVEQQEGGLSVGLEAVDGGTDGDEGPQCLGEPDAQQVHLEQHVVGHTAAPVTHEQVVEGGADPGGQAGRHVRPGQPRDGEAPPRQHPGDGRQYEDGGQGVRQDVDGLVVPVGQAGDAAHDVKGWPVVGVDVLVEPDEQPDDGHVPHCGRLEPT